MTAAGFKRFKLKQQLYYLLVMQLLLCPIEQVGYSSYEIVETMERAVLRAAELAKQYRLVLSCYLLLCQFRSVPEL